MLNLTRPIGLIDAFNNQTVATIDPYFSPKIRPLFQSENWLLDTYFLPFFLCESDLEPGVVKVQGNTSGEYFTKKRNFCQGLH